MADRARLSHLPPPTSIARLYHRQIHRAIFRVRYRRLQALRKALSTAATPSTPKTSSIYDTLEGQADDTIRLLEVRPGTTDSINCGIFTVRLSEEPSYIALSYVWGNEEPTERISIDGKSFFIRPNLYAFLDRLQHQPGPKWVWADAICVNQANFSERNAQVLLMSKVYTQAHTVIAWLGADLKFQVAQKLAETMDWEAVRRLLGQGVTSLRRNVHNGFLRVFARGVCEAVALLASNPYWDRAWIVQEVLSNANTTTWYGMTGRLSLSDFSKNYWFFVEFYERGPVVENLFRRGYLEFLQSRLVLQQLFDFKYGRRVRGDLPTLEGPFVERSLTTLVRHGLLTECTDVRDKIYAFWGMASDIDEYDIIPDYGKPAADLFFDFFIAKASRKAPFGVGYDFYELPEALRIGLGCSYADLFASSRFKVLDRTASNFVVSFAWLKSKLLLALQSYTIDGLIQEGSQPFVVTGPVLNVPALEESDSRANFYSTKVYKRDLAGFVVAMASAGQERSPNDLFEDLGSDAFRTRDVYLTYHQLPPVPLYHLGCMDRSGQADLGEAETKTKLRGISRYILDDSLFQTDSGKGPVQSGIWMKEDWRTIVQWSLAKYDGVLKGEISLDKLLQPVPASSKEMLKEMSSKISLSLLLIINGLLSAL